MKMHVVTGSVRMVIQKLSALVFKDAYKNEVYTELASGIRKPKDIRHPYLHPVHKDSSFKLKSDHDTVIQEIHQLEDLHKAIERAPPEAIVFHMNERNDFANWIGDVVGYQILSQKVNEIELDEPERTRWKLVGALYKGVYLIKARRPEPELGMRTESYPDNF